MKLKALLLFTVIVYLSGCIKDDIIFDEVDEVVRITNRIDSIQIGTTYQLEVDFLNNIGQREDVNIDWETTNAAAISVSEDGLLTALAMGTTTIIATAEVSNEQIKDSLTIAVSEDETVIVEPPMERTGSIQTTTFYTLEGDFTLIEETDGLTLTFEDNYVASAGLPGLYVYLTNNPNTTNNAFEIGKVETFNGAHSYTIDSSVDINEYSYVLYFCKPFNVKVGDGTFDD